MSGEVGRRKSSLSPTLSPISTSSMLTPGEQHSPHSTCSVSTSSPRNSQTHGSRFFRRPPSPPPETNIITDLGRGVVWLCLPAPAKDVSEKLLADLTEQIVSAFTGPGGEERVSAQSVSAALRQARGGDTGWRMAGSPSVADVHALEPEEMPELDRCKWTGDGHYNMDLFPGQQPPSLVQVVRFLRLLDVVTPQAELTLVLSSPVRRATVSVLVGASLVLAHGDEPEAVWEAIVRSSPAVSNDPKQAWDRFPGPFCRMGSVNQNSLRVVDCLAGLATASDLGWLEGHQKFDIDGWLLLRRKFDASWIIPGEILAMANPGPTALNPAFPGLLEGGVHPASAAAAEATLANAAARRSSGRKTWSPPHSDISSPRHAAAVNTAGWASPKPGVRRTKSSMVVFSRNTSSGGGMPKASSAGCFNKATKHRFFSNESGMSGVDGSDMDSRASSLPTFDSFADDLQDGDLRVPLEDWDEEELETKFKSEGVLAGLYSESTSEERVYLKRYPLKASRESSGSKSRSSFRGPPPMRPRGDCQEVRLSDAECDEEGSVAGSTASDSDFASHGAEAELLASENFVSFLRRGCIEVVLRLNYEKEFPQQSEHELMFENCGLEVKAMPFTDGDIPPKAVVQAFYEMMKGLSRKSPDKCVVVHCMGGLGRTGSLIGTYAVSKYGMSGKAFHGWTRMVRPGTVQTEKQEVFVRGLKRRIPLLKAGLDKVKSMMNKSSSAAHLRLALSPSKAFSSTGQDEECEDGMEPAIQMVLHVIDGGGIAEL